MKKVGEGIGMRYIMAGKSLELDAERCVGCGMCLEVCPHAVFGLSDGKAAVRDRGACMECGACALNCPVAAIKVESGVGCAYAVLNARLKGKSDCSCGDDCCGDDGACC